MSDQKATPDFAETLDKISKGFLHGHRMTHAGVVVTAAAILDHIIERAIKTKMPTLSQNLSKKLFEDFGPLSSFSAKIDLAHALDITSAAIHSELGKIRKIRNEFSHSQKLLSLDVDPIRPLFDGLTRPPGAAGNYAEVFLACVNSLCDYLEEYLLRMGITDDLSEKRMPKNPPPAPSPSGG
jgi:hypothetical protein